ncbi:MAG TPA: PAS domain-containing protein, partial [Clostridia bacterium]
MHDAFYQSILEETSTAYSYHRILLDDGGLPCDFLFLEASPDSVRFSGLHLPAALGRRAGEVLPALAAGGTDWIRRFGEVAMSGRAADFAGEPPITAIPCTLHVYSPQRGYFVILYQPEKTLPQPAMPEMKSARPQARNLAEATAFLVHAEASPATDRSVADTALRLSGARYAAYQRIDPDGKGFETVAVAGMSADTLAALADLGVCLEGRRWHWGPDGAVHIPRQGTVVYPDAAALAAALLPSSLGVLAAGIGTGEAVIAGIPGSDSPAGFFVLLMPDGGSFDCHDLLTAYAGQLGNLLARQRAEARLHDLSEARLPEPLEQAKTVFDQSPCALYLIRVLQDGDFRFERVNRAAGAFFADTDPAAAVGRSPREVFGADRGGRIAAHFARCVRE